MIKLIMASFHEGKCIACNVEAEIQRSHCCMHTDDSVLFFRCFPLFCLMRVAVSAPVCSANHLEVATLKQNKDLKFADQFLWPCVCIHNVAGEAVSGLRRDTFEQASAVCAAGTLAPCPSAGWLQLFICAKHGCCEVQWQRAAKCR